VAFLLIAYRAADRKHRRTITDASEHANGGRKMNRLAATIALLYPDQVESSFIELSPTERKEAINRAYDALDAADKARIDGQVDRLKSVHRMGEVGAREFLACLGILLNKEL